ncbi:unnamed protein product [marine sediment metagenome]|uniref:Uncharacterized protein n=1 Tax=marine sediment metagenome TaxID=412755 RepID=X1E646_9ZZZZ
MPPTPRFVIGELILTAVDAVIFALTQVKFISPIAVILKSLPIVIVLSFSVIHLLQIAIQSI